MMQRGRREACSPRTMDNLLDAALFLIFVVFLLMLPRPVETRDICVWTDEVERKLLKR
jgi:hypothetical protein